MPNNYRSASGGDDSSAFFLLVIFGGAAVLGALGWMNFHTEISTAAANWLMIQIRILSPLFPSLAPLGDIVRGADLSQVTLPQIWQVLSAVDAPLRWPVALLMGGLGVLCFLRAAPAQFTRPLDLDGLIAEQARWVRPLAPFLSRRLKLTPLLPDKIRPADPALHREEWIDRFARNEAGAFDEAQARAALAAQLGGRWRGVENASPIARFFFAVFALHLAQKRDDMQALLGDFAEALPPGDRNAAAGAEQALPFPRSLFGRADKILSDLAIVEPAAAIAARHAFVASALMGLLTAARRRGGVLAPAQFVGLKLVDRSLWYALHSLGFEGDSPGQTTHPNPRIEAAAARDHWEAERRIGLPIQEPSIDRALDAVRADLMQTSRNDFSAGEMK